MERLKAKYTPLRSLEEALALWQSSTARPPLEAEELPTQEALGRVSAEAHFARLSSPGFMSAAMDGYAVAARDTFGASETSPKRLKVPGQAVPVDTGRPMPPGTDAVLAKEEGQEAQDCIEITAPAYPYRNVRTVGEDIVATEMLLPEGHRLRPVDLAALLQAGLTTVRVRRRPRVAIIPTGSDVVEPTACPPPGTILDSNSTMLEALARDCGAQPLRHGIVPDEPRALREALRWGLREADVVLTIAGASVGRRDFTLACLREVAQVLLEGIAIRPGKPTILAISQEGKPLVGIPGYPVSAYLAFKLFAEPLLWRLQGLEPPEPQYLEGLLGRDVASPLGQEEFLRVKVGRVGGRYIITPLQRGAGLLMSLVRADALLRVPAMSEGLAQGSEVQVQLLRSLQEIRHTIVCIGSHDSALDVLASRLRRLQPRLSLSTAHVGSMAGLLALKRGQAHVAPTHLLDEATGQYNVPFIKRLLPERPVVLVNFLYRLQGLLVRPGNPKGIRGFRDLAREDVVFVNRQRGSGTRLLLDAHLRALGIEPSQVRGYHREEFTHMAVAAQGASGAADCGLAVASAAKALGLEFIPVAQERYDLAIPGEFLQEPMIRALLQCLREDEALRETLQRMGGYDLRDMGRLMWEGP